MKNLFFLFLLTFPIITFSQRYDVRQHEANYWKNQRESLPPSPIANALSDVLEQSFSQFLGELNKKNKRYTAEEIEKYRVYAMKVEEGYSNMSARFYAKMDSSSRKIIIEEFNLEGIISGVKNHKIDSIFKLSLLERANLIQISEQPDNGESLINLASEYGQKNAKIFLELQRIPRVNQNVAYTFHNDPLFFVKIFCDKSIKGSCDLVEALNNFNGLERNDRVLKASKKGSPFASHIIYKYLNKDLYFCGDKITSKKQGGFALKGKGKYISGEMSDYYFDISVTQYEEFLEARSKKREQIDEIAFHNLINLYFEKNMFDEINLLLEKFSFLAKEDLLAYAGILELKTSESQELAKEYLKNAADNYSFIGTVALLKYFPKLSNSTHNILYRPNNWSLATRDDQAANLSYGFEKPYENHKGYITSIFPFYLTNKKWVISNKFDCKSLESVAFASKLQSLDSLENDFQFVHSIYNLKDGYYHPDISINNALFFESTGGEKKMDLVRPSIYRSITSPIDVSFFKERIFMGRLHMEIIEVGGTLNYRPELRDVNGKYHSFYNLSKGERFDINDADKIFLWAIDILNSIKVRNPRQLKF